MARPWAAARLHARLYNNYADFVKIWRERELTMISAFNSSVSLAFHASPSLGPAFTLQSGMAPRVFFIPASMLRFIKNGTITLLLMMMHYRTLVRVPYESIKNWMRLKSSFQREGERTKPAALSRGAIACSTTITKGV